MTEQHQRLQRARVAANFSTATDAARAFGWNENTYRSHENGERGIKRTVAEIYAKAFRVSAAWLLTGEGEPPMPRPTSIPVLPRQPSEISQPMPAPQFSQKRLPVYGLARGGDDGRFEFNGEIVDTVPCPPGLENVPGAYALWVAGESMVPRFKPGETVWVHPGRPPRRGDDVVIQIHPDNDGEPPEGYIKEFVAWTPTLLTVRQHNPQQEIDYERDTVKSVHVIVGLLKI